MDKILKSLIDDDLYEFKCFDILKQKLKEDSKFYELIKEGINDGLITKFPRDLFDNVCAQNIRAPFKPIQLFVDGANIGNCTIMSKIVSYSLDNCYICGGTLKAIKGTKNSPDGRHTWISYNGKIIDTSLMIQINEQLMNKLGYIEENRYNPNQDHIYLAAKEFANDNTINKKR